MFRPHWVCPIQGCLFFPRLHCSGSRLLYMELALCWVRFQFSGTPQKRGFGCACILCLPWPERLRQPEVWAHSPGCGAPFPPTASSSGSQRLGRPLPRCGTPFPSARSGSGSQGLGRTLPGCGAPFPPEAPARAAGRVPALPSVQRSWPLAATLPAEDSQGACLQCGRGWLLWGWVFPFPLPPASYLQLGWASCSLEFLSPFVLRTSGSVFGRLIFSLAVPQFERAPSNCSQGLRASPYPKQCCPLLSVRTYLLVAGAGVWGTFLLGVAFRHVICGPYLIFPER